MSSPIQRRALAVALATLLGVGCASAGGSGPSGPLDSGAGAAAPTGVDDATRAELEALYRARADSALANHTPADVDFMHGMIVHHAQALVMAGLAGENDAGPQVRTLAGRILTGQRDEIATMERWLEDRVLPVPEIHVDGVELVVHGVDHDHDMPGMISVEGMRALEAARGTAFDRLFLTYMIEHHRGAIVMVDELMGSDGAAHDPLVFKLASGIYAEQTSEIARMESMLAALSL